MRLASFFCSIFLLTGISAAQDTNFPFGPQYLITTDSPLFLHPIATPTLSLSAPLASVSGPVTESTPQPPSPFVAVASQPDLTRIFWGEPEVKATPAANVGENVTENASEIEITSAQPTRTLPASILDTGVTAMTTVQSLRQRGYGVPLGDTASFWKIHKPRATRVYTNADVQRLHQS